MRKAKSVPPEVIVAESKRRYPDKMIGGDVNCIRAAFVEGWMLGNETNAILFAKTGESA